MRGLFFKTLVRRTLIAISNPKPRRRRMSLRASLECLESRALLSAVGYEDPSVSAEVRVITAESSAPPTGREVARRTRPTPLFADGAITIDTPLGPITLDGEQHGSRIQGTADLSGIDLAKAAQLGIQIPPILNLITLPTVNFNGSFRNNQLEASFKTTLKIPLAGNFEFAGNVSGSVDVGQQQLNGHLTVTANGDTILEKDFTSTLPTLPGQPDVVGTPRIANVAGVHEFGSAALGDGSMTITQAGLDIHGTIVSPNLTSGAFDAHFRTDRARQAKGTAQLQFTDQQTPENDKFFISFFKDGSLNRFRFR